MTKRIIQVTSYYPPHLGGQENAVYDLATQLALAGHDTRVLTSTAGGGPAGVTNERGVQVYRLPGIVFGHAPIMPEFPATLFRLAPADSVVHLHIGQAFTPEMVLLISRLRKFRYIAQLHIDFKPSGPAGILLPLYKQLLLKPVLQSAAAVFVLNEQTAQNVRSTYNYNGKIHIVNNGIDDAYFAVERLALEPTPPSTLQLLFVGRLSKQKNINALLRALRLTKRSVHVDLVGDGEERESVLRAIAEYGLRNITLHGRLSREAVMKLYQTCHALVLPSLYEAQPLVLLEAMAAQIPIIGTDVIGVAEHIRDAGIIVEPSPEGIAKGFDQYYYRYSRLPEMIKQGYKAAQNLRWAHNLKHYEALYEDISRS